MAIQTPDWVKHAVFYQIFPDRFARSGQSKSGIVKTKSFEKWESSFEKWESPPTLQGLKGGDLWGVVEHLNYLQDLGITAIYFTPLFQSHSNHRYGTRDYYQIDPLLGGNEAFDELLRKAHEKEIKIVLDGVFNHVGRDFYAFSDVLENGENSLWKDWFKIQDWPLYPYDKSHPANYFCWNNHRALPQLNHENQDVREYIMRVGEYWVRKGIDGWRLDVPDCIKVDGFWQEFRQRVKAINPEAYIVGEILVNMDQWLDGDQFDGVMNYRLRTHTIVFPAQNNLNSEYLKGWQDQLIPLMDAEGYSFKINRLLQDYDWQIHLTQLNMLSSHDTPRLATVVNKELASMELATLLLLTFPGAPCIFYGDEVGMVGGDDPDCRRGFLPKEKWHQDVLNYHRELIAIRHKYPVLRIGSYQTLLAWGNVYIFARFLDNEVLIIAVNVGELSEEVQVRQPLDSQNQINVNLLKAKPETVLYGSGVAHWLGEGDSVSLTVALPARSSLVLGPTR